MKVLMVNGSPRQNGNTARTLKEVADALAKEGVESEVVWIGVKPVRGCIACGQCKQKSLGRCAFDDDIANRIVEKLADADGIVLEILGRDPVCWVDSGRFDEITSS